MQLQSGGDRGGECANAVVRAAKFCTGAGLIQQQLWQLCMASRYDWLHA